MISHGKQRVGRDAELSNEKNPNHIAEFNVSAASELRLNKDAFGDLMRFLADSYENRRARQTSEWETMRRQSLRRAS